MRRRITRFPYSDLIEVVAGGAIAYYLLDKLVCKRPHKPIGSCSESSATAEADTAKVAKYAKQFEEDPEAYSFDLHNELRHHFSGQDKKRGHMHTDIILKNEPMQSYIMDVLSGWNLGKDDDLSIVNFKKVLRETKDYPHIQAACMVKAAELLKERGELEEAQSLLEKVAGLQGEHLDTYKELASLKLKNRKTSD
jgi:hypothetical protein